MTAPQVVILNDTSQRHHHGCSRVMRLLCAGLEGRGFVISARSPARHDWSKDGNFLQTLDSAQLVVINGEGTLHDGAAAGEMLLRVIDRTKGIPVALINALWQNNPDHWGQWLDQCALVAARDSASAAAMRSQSTQDIRWLPDLSLSQPADLPPQQRRGIIVGDSVKAPARHHLARAASRWPGATFVPTKTLHSSFWTPRLTRAALFRVYTKSWTGPVPAFDLPQTEAAYLDILARAEAHITGRFHAVCLSMLTATPFLALGSVTSKIQSLLTDSGLGLDRLLDPATLDHLTLVQAIRPFSAAEQDAINSTLSRAQTQAAALFGDLRALVT